MGNLIRAEFYRLRRRPHSVLGMALILLLGVSLLTVSCALPPQVGSAATLLQSISTLSVSGMFFAVWCAAAASSGVNKLDILKHEAVSGIPRWQIYLSRLATACLLGVGLVAPSVPVGRPAHPVLPARPRPPPRPGAERVATK